MASEAEVAALDSSAVAASGRAVDALEDNSVSEANQKPQHGAVDSAGRGGVYDKVDHKASGPSKCLCRYFRIF